MSIPYLALAKSLHQESCHRAEDLGRGDARRATADDPTPSPFCAVHEVDLDRAWRRGYAAQRRPLDIEDAYRDGLISGRKGYLPAVPHHHQGLYSAEAWRAGWRVGKVS